MATRIPRLTCARAVRAGLALLTAAVVSGLATVATAQNYPTRPITLIVPFPPGGSTTIVARIVTDRMADVIGQQFVVDNRGGAGGTLGTRQVAKSAPDGYTIALGYTGTLAIGPSLFRNVGYDVRADFAPIGRIGVAPSALVVHPSFPVHSVAELIAYAKANPGKVNYGSAGIGTVGHVAGEYFAIATGIKLTHIPYKGSSPALTDLIGGHVAIYFSSLPPAIALIKEGKVRALAVTGPQRSPLLPELPTVAEAALPGYEAVLHYGIVAPAGTPRPIIDKLNAALTAALAQADVRERIVADGAELLSTTPEEYAADIDREETKWSKVVKVSGAKVE